MSQSEQNKSPVVGGGMVCFRDPKDSTASGEHGGALWERRWPEDRSHRLFLKPG